jgi:hypothetical protein
VSRQTGESLRRTEAEIAAEKAATLGRAGERLEEVLREARAALARLDVAEGVEERRLRLADYERARARVARERLTLIIQREAVGLRQHRVVDQQFPELPRRS